MLIKGICREAQKLSNLQARKDHFRNVRVGYKKYKRIKVDSEMAAKIKKQKEEGFSDDLPECFTPSRTKLYLKIFQKYRNNHRFSRKPIEPEVKAEFMQKCKEYQEYKHHQHMETWEEIKSSAIAFHEAKEACLLLPEELLIEALKEEKIEEKYQQIREHMPIALYLEQYFQMVPRNVSLMYKLTGPIGIAMKKKTEEKSLRGKMGRKYGNK